MKSVAQLLSIWIAVGCMFMACYQPVSQEGALCNADHPCGDDLECVAGKCKVLKGALTVCTSDKDCLLPNGVQLKCLDNKSCVPCIPGKGGCQKGDYCTSGYYCVDCLSHWHCETNLCVDNVCRGCKSDNQCLSQMCLEGVCAEK